MKNKKQAIWLGAIIFLVLFVATFFLGSFLVKEGKIPALDFSQVKTQIYSKQVTFPGDGLIFESGTKERETTATFDHSGFYKIKASVTRGCADKEPDGSIDYNTCQDAEDFYMKIGNVTTQVAKDNGPACPKGPINPLNCDSIGECFNGEFTHTDEQVMPGGPYYIEKGTHVVKIIHADNDKGYPPTAQSMNINWTKLTADVPICGNKAIEENEQCDDGNTDNGDGCNNQCRLEDSSIDLNKSVSDSSVSIGQEVTYNFKIKNTGETNLSNIELEDNKLGGISCPKSSLSSGEEMSCSKKANINDDITNEATVTGDKPSGGSVSDKDTAEVAVLEECGNEQVEGAEQCDLGPGNGQTCTAPYGGECTYCSDQCENVNIKGPFCGDNTTTDPPEKCDFGIDNGQVCTPVYEGDCNYCSNQCANVIVNGPYCGDGARNGPEQCDAGVNNGSICTPVYGGDCSYCDAQCEEKTVSGPYCGDGNKNGSEQCDSGSDNGKVCNPAYGGECSYCSSQCTTEIVKGPYCGDGNKSGSEQCDWGGDNGKLCNPDYGGDCNYCSSQCELKTIGGPYCGDGSKNGSEQCDAGNDNGKVCTPDYGGECSYCTNQCTEKTVGGVYCGDDIKNGSEECDGNDGVGAGQSCDNNCKLSDVPGNISLNKTASPTLINPGQEVSYTYKVTNTGNVDLSDVKVTDDKISSISCPSTALNAGKSMTCTAKQKINADTTNTGTVIGKTPVGKEVKDTDKAAVSTEEEPPEPPEEPDEPEEDCEGSIGNYIWFDTNGDGIQDDNESGISGVKVVAYRGNKKYSDKTDSKGRYEIDELCKGTYDVRVKTEDVVGLSQTYDPDGKLDNKTEVKLKNNNDNHTKADFGYRGGAAPKTGIGTNIAIILLISLAVTAGVMAMLIKLGKV